MEQEDWKSPDIDECIETREHEEEAAWQYMFEVERDYLGAYRVLVAYRQRIVELEKECKSLHQRIEALL